MYHWDLDNDGLGEEGEAGVSVSHSFSAGSHSVKLKVKDNDNAWSAVTSCTVKAVKVDLTAHKRNGSVAPDEGIAPDLWLANNSYDDDDEDGTLDWLDPGGYTAGIYSYGARNWQQAAA